MPSALAAENLKRTRHGGSPPERQRLPRPGRVPTLHDIPIDIPRGAVPVRVLGVPACAGGVPGAAPAAGPVPLAAAGERAARPRSEDRRECGRIGRVHRSAPMGWAEYSGGRVIDPFGVLSLGSHSVLSLGGVLGVLTRSELRLDSHGGLGMAP
jgi:hypothetical protein